MNAFDRYRDGRQGILGDRLADHVRDRLRITLGKLPLDLKLVALVGDGKEARGLYLLSDSVSGLLEQGLVTVERQELFRLKRA